MKKPSKAESKEAGKHVAALIQQFKNLEYEWKSLEKSRSQNPRTRSTLSGNSSITNSIITASLLENSPRELMSCLQQRRSSPSSGGVINCDMAVEEILRDRRAAIMTGKLRGRCLFPAADKEESGGSVSEIICEREVNIINENELPVGSFNQSCSFSDSSTSEEKLVVAEDEKTVVEVAKRGGDRKVRGGGGYYMVAMASFGFVLVLFILGFICMSCNGKFVQENDQLILVPT